MSIFSTIKRVFFLEPVFPYINSVDRYLIVPASLVLNLLRGATDVLGVYTFAKSIELIINDDETDFVGMQLNAKHLLYATSVFYAYSRISPYLIRAMVTPARRHLVKNLQRAILEKTHKLSYDDIYKYKNELEQSLQYTKEVSELVTTIPSNIHQPIISFAAGCIIVYVDYGYVIGSVFLSYVILKTLSGVAAYELLGSTEYTRQANTQFNKFIGRYKELMSNYDLVKTFNRHNLELVIGAQLSRLFAIPYSANVNCEAWAYLLSGLLPFVADVGVVSYSIYGGDIAIDVDRLIFLLNFLSTINANSTRFIEAAYRSFKLTVAYEEIEKVLKLSEEDSTQEVEDDDWYHTVMSQGASIKFNNVSFRYSPESEYVLHDVTFTIDPRQHCAIVGNSGSGKTTIGKLVTRLYRPSHGSIEINGKDINTIPAATFYSIVGYLPQEAHLLEQDTVDFNVAYGINDNDNFLLDLKNNKGMVELLKPEYQGESDDDEPILPQQMQSLIRGRTNYNPVIGHCYAAMRGARVDNVNNNNDTRKKTGHELSVGQKQRVGIARLLARHSKIFVFDEPTAALDTETEFSVTQTINQIVDQRTSVTIAHRLNTIKNSDKIIVLDEGRVVQEGTHTKLINEEGKYKTLCSIQLGL